MAVWWEIPPYGLEAKFRYASWFEAGSKQTGLKPNFITLSGSKLVGDRLPTSFEPASKLFRTSFEPPSVMEFGF